MAKSSLKGLAIEPPRKANDVKNLLKIIIDTYNFYNKENLEKYSLKKLETLLLSIPTGSNASEKQRDLAESIIFKRNEMLMKQFKPSQKNILRVVKVSDKFLKAWENGFVMAKVMLDALYEREQNKASFKDKYKAKIKLYPQVFYKNSINGEWEERGDVHNVLMDYFDPICGICMSLDYDPATKDESDFWNNQHHVSGKENWNCFACEPDFFKDYHLCYAIHELHEHNNFAWQDIARINNIEVTVEILHREEIGRF